MHQIEFVDQATLFQQVEGAIDGGPIDARIARPSHRQQSRRVNMSFRPLNRFNEDPALGGYPHPLRNEFPHQRAPLEVSNLHISCD